MDLTPEQRQAQAELDVLLADNPEQQHTNAQAAVAEAKQAYDAKAEKLAENGIVARSAKHGRFVYAPGIELNARALELACMRRGAIETTLRRMKVLEHIVATGSSLSRPFSTYSAPPMRGGHDPVTGKPGLQKELVLDKDGKPVVRVKSEQITLPEFTPSERHPSRR